MRQESECWLTKDQHSNWIIQYIGGRKVLTFIFPSPNYQASGNLIFKLLIRHFSDEAVKGNSEDGVYLC
jgi:hypothetical protein